MTYAITHGEMPPLPPPRSLPSPSMAPLLPSWREAPILTFRAADPLIISLPHTPILGQRIIGYRWPMGNDHLTLLQLFYLILSLFCGLFPWGKGDNHSSVYIQLDHFFIYSILYQKIFMFSFVKFDCFIPVVNDENVFPHHFIILAVPGPKRRWRTRCPKKLKPTKDTRLSSIRPWKSGNKKHASSTN